MFYRESARELKRLDSSLRSLLYSHFAESLSGLATIHAYGVTDRFLKEDNFLIDLVRLPALVGIVTYFVRGRKTARSI